MVPIMLTDSVKPGSLSGLIGLPICSRGAIEFAWALPPQAGRSISVPEHNRIGRKLQKRQCRSSYSSRLTLQEESLALGQAKIDADQDLSNAFCDDYARHPLE